MKLQSLSSCGDIAVSVYSGWLAYSTFDHEWVKHQIEDTTVEEVLIKTGLDCTSNHYKHLKIWKYLSVGLAHRRHHHTFVSEVKRLKSDPSFYGDFLEDSHRCVEKLIHAFKTNNIKGVKDGASESYNYSTYG